MEAIDTQHEQRRQARWGVLQAARAFYGRPLELGDLAKIHAAQTTAQIAQGQSSPPIRRREGCLPRSDRGTRGSAGKGAVGGTRERGGAGAGREATILIVDDREVNVEYLAALLRADGYRRILTTAEIEAQRGTQFDPRVVDAFHAALAERAERADGKEMGEPARGQEAEPGRRVQPHDVLISLVDDLAAGGDEFVVLLAGADADEATGVAEMIRRKVASGGGRAEVRGVSIGVASGVAERGGDPAALVARADAALYEAKRGGRNRVRWYGSDWTGRRAEDSGTGQMRRVA